MARELDAQRGHVSSSFDEDVTQTRPNILEDQPVVVAEWLVVDAALSLEVVECLVRSLFRIWKRREGDTFEQVGGARAEMLIRLLYPDAPARLRGILEPALRGTRDRASVEALFLQLGRVLEILHASEAIAGQRTGPAC